MRALSSIPLHLLIEADQRLISKQSLPFLRAIDKTLLLQQTRALLVARARARRYLSFLPRFYAWQKQLSGTSFRPLRACRHVAPGSALRLAPQSWGRILC